MSYRFVDSPSGIHHVPARKAVYKPVWHISLLSVQWISSWWWTKELPETCMTWPVWHIPLLGVQWIISWWWTKELSEKCRLSCQNKFVKLAHLVGFIIKKSLNPLAYTAGCETRWAIDAFAVNSGFVSVDGMTCLIPFESWRNDLSNGISYI
jgi:hypothetical protein